MFIILNLLSIPQNNPTGDCAETVHDPDTTITSADMEGIQTYERPIVRSPVHKDAIKTFVNPCFFFMNDLPSQRHSRILSTVYADPIFDHPEDQHSPVTVPSADYKYEKPAADIRTLINQLKKAEIKKIKRNDIRYIKNFCFYKAMFGL